MSEAPHASWAASLLAPSETPTWTREGRRLLSSAGLAALYGAALGARHGAAAMLTHAAGVPLAMLAVATIAVPAFAIVLALADAPFDGLELAHATARAAAHAGLILAGLAPVLALFVLTAEEETTGALVAIAGLTLAAAVAARSFARQLFAHADRAPTRARFMTRGAIPLFLVFAAALAARAFVMTLPILASLA